MIPALFTVEPPPSDTARAAVADTFGACDYPWWRLLPRLGQRGDSRVAIRWRDHQLHGETVDQGRTVWLSTRYGTGPDRYTALRFTVAHELGHVVDHLTLDPVARQALWRLLHSDVHPDHNSRDRFGADAASPDPDRHRETWWGSEVDYLLRPSEAFADAWVAAYAPTIWAGQHRRFIHWPADMHAFRALVEREPILLFADVPAAHPHRQSIEWAAAHGLTVGDGLGRFRPDEPVTRGQMATFLHRLTQLLST